jgi:hypothetical protein
MRARQRAVAATASAMPRTRAWDSPNLEQKDAALAAELEELLRIG